MQDLERGGGKKPQRARDVGRKRKADLPKKRLHILLDPNSKAFPNWQDVQGMWTLEICEVFIDWYHMNKAFALARHLMICAMNKCFIYIFILHSDVLALYCCFDE